VGSDSIIVDVDATRGTRGIVLAAGAVACSCADMVSDSADATSLVGILMTGLLALLGGLMFVRREEML